MTALAFDRYTPRRAALWWMLGTFGAFLVLGQVDEVDNLVTLTVAVLGFTAAFWFGYGLSATSKTFSTEPRPISQRLLRTLVIVAALHYLAYGIVYLREYGFSDPGNVIQAVINPGSSYLGKFEVFERQRALGVANSSAQLLTLAAPLAAPLIPFLIVYWSRLTMPLRVLGVIGLGSYVTFFLAIGTLAGIGSSAVFAGVSLMVLRAKRGRQLIRVRRSVRLLALIGTIGFIAYMSYSQGSRLVESNLTKDERFAANPFIASVTGDQFAQGLSATAFYPTHGYQGLAYNLDTPFEWTNGLGAARALDSYAEQYGLADSVRADTYPARTEVLTGWPQGQYWATIYPWLASDLTWVGIPFFMLLVGWWTARWWREAVVREDPLALLLLCQMGLLIAFIPANNQIGLSRPNLITLVALLSVYFLRQASRAVSGTDERPSLVGRESARSQSR